MFGSLGIACEEFNPLKLVGSLLHSHVCMDTGYPYKSDLETKSVDWDIYFYNHCLLRACMHVCIEIEYEHLTLYMWIIFEFIVVSMHESSACISINCVSLSTKRHVLGILCLAPLVSFVDHLRGIGSHSFKIMCTTICSPCSKLTSERFQILLFLGHEFIFLCIWQSWISCGTFVHSTRSTASSRTLCPWQVHDYIKVDKPINKYTSISSIGNWVKIKKVRAVWKPWVPS